MQDLSLRSPWMNAAGMLGFTPGAQAAARWPLSEPMGAFVTNPISLGPRTPAAERALLPYPGGALMHSGLPNPGLSRVLRRFSARWAQSTAPVWAHLIAASPDELHGMIRRLEGVEGVSAVEIGLPPGARGEAALAFVEAAFGELPLVVSLALTMVDEPWLEELPRLGASAVTLSAPRGSLLNESGRPVTGRLYGRSILPLALAAVQSARRIKLPVIAAGGIFCPQDGQALLDAGAWALQIDLALWGSWASQSGGAGL